MNRLDALCGKIRFKAREGKPKEAQELLETVSHCLSWTQANQDASMFCFDSRFDEILEKAKAVFPSDRDFIFHISKSAHVFEMSTLTAKSLMDQGESDLKNNNLKNAFECFQKAYSVASTKGKVEKILAALTKMGYVRRLQVEQGHMQRKRWRTVLTEQL